MSSVPSASSVRGQCVSWEVLADSIGMLPRSNAGLLDKVLQLAALATDDC